MHIIINNSSMVPIYEQIIDQIKSAIIRGELQPDTVLPSVRSLSKELMREEQLKEVEHDLEQAIMKGRRCGLNDEEIRNLFEMIMED